MKHPGRVERSTAVKAARRIARMALLSLAAVALVGCGSKNGVIKPHAGGTFAHYTEAPRLHVSATFGPDGRLWRLVPTQSQIFVDHSTDLGKTFSAPVLVNPESQHIQTKDEDRPQITVDRKGHVYVAYAAYSTLPWTTWLSVSDERGGSFSPPVNVSDKAREARHSQTRMAVDPNDHLHVYWHDDREQPHGLQGGGNALFHASVEHPGEIDKLVQANERLMEAQCECCRMALDFDGQGQPVLFTRFVYAGSARDHGLVRRIGGGKGWTSWRVTEDEWQINACPEHGPALDIAADGRYHVVWFTQGKARKGLFYAYSTDEGRHFSNPLGFGEPSELAGHADVLATGERVVLVWKEFDGRATRIMSMQSRDGGASFAPAKMAGETAGEADYPFLLRNGQAVFLSWNTQNEGYRLIPLD